MDQFRDEFGPETAQTLARAFDLAWPYLRQMLVSSSVDDRDRLALQIGRFGECKTIKVANLAIETFRAESRGRFRAELTDRRRPEEGSIRLQGGG